MNNNNKSSSVSLKNNNKNNNNNNNNMNSKKNGNVKIEYIQIPTPSVGGSNIVGIILLLVFVLAFIASSYWLYNYYNQQTFIKTQEVDVMPDIKNANSKFIVGSGSIPNSNYSNEYSISCWINIKDYNYNYGKEKVIVRRGEKGSGNPEIFLAEKTNDLIVRIKLQGQDNSISNFKDISLPLQVNNLTKENFNISSEPAPANFVKKDIITKHKSQNDLANNLSNNLSNDLSNDLVIDLSNDMPSEVLNKNEEMGDNTVNYPTVEYISNNDKNNYFSMISGNEITNNKIENFHNHEANNNTTTEENNNTTTEENNNTTNEETNNTTNEETNSTGEYKEDKCIECNDSAYAIYPNTDVCIVKMIPLQKWVNIIVSVYNQNVDIYVDGQLSSSCILKRFPDISNEDVKITPDDGFSGMISRVKFTNSAMTIQQAKQIYYDGPVVKDTLFSIIPEWVYWTIFIIIIMSLVYSILM